MDTQPAFGSYGSILTLAVVLNIYVRMKTLFIFITLAALIPSHGWSASRQGNACASLFIDSGASSRPYHGFVPEIATIKRSDLHRAPSPGEASLDKRPFIEAARAKELVETATRPHKRGEFGPRLITDEFGETPDIDKPVWITLPNGERKVFFGLSGQQYLLVDSIDELARGGLVRPRKLRLFNEHGLPYGEDVDANGKKIVYALDSSTWDASAVIAHDENGKPVLKILAGALANGGSGKPLLISQKNAAPTRRRVVFHETEWVADAYGQWDLTARNPKSPFFTTVLRDGTWSAFDADGTPRMIHSYGGGVVKLASGESYPDANGNIHWAGDGVFEVRRVLDAKQNELSLTPFHSGMYMAKVDPTLKNVIEAPHVVLDARKEDGSFYREAERPGIGALVEGGHIEPRVIEKDGSTRAITSRKDLEEIRRQGLKEYMIMVGSQGRYDKNYGSFQAYTEPNSHEFKMVTNEDGELQNLTADFNVLTYATGRPVVVYGEGGQAYAFWHADKRFDQTGRLVDLSRQIWVAPVRLQTKNGVEIYEILDNTGLMKELRKYRARPVK